MQLSAHFHTQRRFSSRFFRTVRAYEKWVNRGNNAQRMYEVGIKYGRIFVNIVG